MVLVVAEDSFGWGRGWFWVLVEDGFVCDMELFWLWQRMVLVLAEDSFGWGRGWFWLWLRIVLVVAEHGSGFGRDSFGCVLG